MVGIMLVRAKNFSTRPASRRPNSNKMRPSIGALRGLEADCVYVGIEQQQSDQLLPALDENSSTAIFAGLRPIPDRWYRAPNCMVLRHVSSSDERRTEINDLNQSLSCLIAIRTSRALARARPSRVRRSAAARTSETLDF